MTCYIHSESILHERDLVESSWLNYSLGLKFWMGFSAIPINFSLNSIYLINDINMLYTEYIG